MDGEVKKRDDGSFCGEKKSHSEKQIACWNTYSCTFHQNWEIILLHIVLNQVFLPLLHSQFTSLFFSAFKTFFIHNINGKHGT